jgi:hypothetical protein
MPDRLKDHGFLALTKADELIRGGPSRRIADLDDIVAEEFHSLVPSRRCRASPRSAGRHGVDKDASPQAGPKRSSRRSCPMSNRAAGRISTPRSCS